MRLWSLHPALLDSKGLVALWREGLLARAVLGGRTTGYRHHPQLERFAVHPDPLRAIDSYLTVIAAEAVGRGYRFDLSKIHQIEPLFVAQVGSDQLVFELDHLRAKLSRRSPARASFLPLRVGAHLLHPVFLLVEGGAIATWERPLKVRESR